MLRSAALALFAVLSSCAYAGPSVVPESNLVKFDEVGLYDVGFALRGEREQVMPLGWTGSFEPRAGITCTLNTKQNGKSTFLLHPPWRSGAGYTYQEFHITLPKAKSIRLRGATAMSAGYVGKSDGVTFRIIAGGQKLLDTHRTDADWQSYDFNLTAWAGKTVTVRFETDSGPKNDSSFDYALWGDRELVIQGAASKTVRHPLPAKLDLAKLYPVQSGTAVPPCAFTHKNSVQVKGDTAIFNYNGTDGEATYYWKLPKSGERSLFGTVNLRAKMTGDKPVLVPVATAANVLWTGNAIGMESSWQSASGKVSCTRKYNVDGLPATLTIVGSIEGKSLVFDVTCDSPLVQSIETGGFVAQTKKTVYTPYYTGFTYYLPVENIFASAYVDWSRTTSSSIALTNLSATYDPMTDGSRNLLSERLVYTAAWHMAETLPNIPNAPSPYRAEMGKRVLLDIWDYKFSDIEQSLNRLADYGVTSGLGIVHVWQRSGYDNALPAHYPAAVDQGGDAGLKSVIVGGNKLGFLMGVHENYMDYYENYENYNVEDVALRSDGKPTLAWKAAYQSYGIRPGSRVKLAETQSPEIHARYGTTASYLDVHSATVPWMYVDFRPGDGKMANALKSTSEIFEFERKAHSGPATGEGAFHWYYSGWLDGVEAQLGCGEWGNGMSMSPAVDFDLLKIHPLQINHGMGYYERWWPALHWSKNPPMSILDQYRMEQMIFGHSSFLGRYNWSHIPTAWLESNLVLPVTSKSSATMVSDIGYQIGGKWVDGTEAAKRGEWNRVRAKYANGLAVTANYGSKPMQVGKVVLPQYGWMADGAGVKAYTATVDGVMADYAETAETVFANARNAADFDAWGFKRIRPTVTEFAQTGEHTFNMAFKWQVGEPLGRDCFSFVHFSQNVNYWDEGIKFQSGHQLPNSKEWKAGDTIADGPHGTTVPAGTPDGDYEASIMIIDNGARFPLEGLDDGCERIKLGVVHVKGGTITFTPEERTYPDRERIYRADLNWGAKVLDFGTVRTNGSVVIRKNGRGWVLRAYPEGSTAEVELSSAKFGTPSVVTSSNGEIPVQKAGGWWKIKLNASKEYTWIEKN